MGDLVQLFVLIGYVKNLANKPKSGPPRKILSVEACHHTFDSFVETQKFRTYQALSFTVCVFFCDQLE